MRLIAVLSFLSLTNGFLSQTIKEIEASRKKTASIHMNLKQGTARDKVDFYNIMAEEFLENQSRSDSAMIYTVKALELAEKEKYTIGLADAKWNLGVNYFYTNSTSKAIVYFIEALKLFEQSHYPEGEFKTWFYLGRAYKDNKEYEKSRTYFNKYLDRALAKNDNKSVVKVYREIAGAYNLEKNKTEALNITFKSLLFSKSKKDTNLIARGYNEVGTFFRWNQDAKTAFLYYDSALAILPKMNLDLKASIYNNFGNTYMSLENYKSGIKYYEMAIAVAEENGDFGMEALITRNVGLAYADQKKYALMEKCMLKSLELCKLVDFKDMEMMIYYDLSDFYREAKDYKKALLFKDTYTRIKDSLNDQEANRKSVEMEMNYNFEKKELAAKSEQEIKDRVVQEEANKQKIIRNSFIAGFCLILSFAIFIFRSFKQKQRANTIISKQKEEVEKQKDVIEEQKALVEEKNKEVMDSIRYAKRIQTALMSSEKSIINTMTRLRKNKL